MQTYRGVIEFTFKLTQAGTLAEANSVVRVIANRMQYDDSRAHDVSMDVYEAFEAMAK